MNAAVVAGLLCGGAVLACDTDASAAAPKRAALALAALLLMALSPARARRLPPALLAWLAFVAWMAGTLAWGSSAGRADLLGWVTAAALALALLALPAHEARRASEVAAVVIGGAASAWVGAQWLAGARGAWLTGGQGNPDWLGVTLAVALPGSVAWARRGARPRWSLLALEALGLACARSRTAMLAALAALLVLGVAGAGPRWRARALLLAGALALSSSAALTALGGRLWIWRWSWAVALRRFPVGSGLGGFGAAFAEAQAVGLHALAPAEAERRFVLTSSAHHDWLQALAEGGLPALALLLVTCALAARAHWRAGWRVGAATLAALAVAALAETPLRQPAVLALLALTLAACPSPSTPPRAWRLAPLLALAAACLACALPWWWAERLTTQAGRAPLPERAALLARAAALDGGSPAVAFERGLAALALGDADAAVASLARARAAGWQIAYDLALGNAWLARDEAGRAAAAYAHALVRAPGSVRARLALAEALRRLGRRAEAEQALAQARRQRPSAAAVRTLAARLDDGDG